MQTRNIIALRAGLYASVFLVIAGIIFRVANVAVSSSWNWVFYAVLPVLAWSVIRTIRQQDGDASFKVQFVAASLATAVASAIYCAYVLLYNLYIDGSQLAAVEAFLRQAAVDAGKTGESLELVNQLAATFTRPWPFAITVFLQLATAGVTFSLSFALWYRWRGKRAMP